jgi:hypothetical protein
MFLKGRLGVCTDCEVQSLSCYLKWLLLEGELSGKRTGLRKMSPACLEKDQAPPVHGYLLSSSRFLH